MKQLPKIIHTVFNGKAYDICLEELDGLCDPPDGRVGIPCIYVLKGFKDDVCTLETLLHEMIHAIRWRLPHKTCEQIAKEMAPILLRLYKPRY